MTTPSRPLGELPIFSATSDGKAREETIDQVFTFLVAGSAAAMMISIAVSEILFGAACLVWIVRRPKPIVWPRHLVPLGAYMAASLLSLAFSPDPGVGAGSVFRKFFLLLMALLGANAIRSARNARLASGLILTVAAGTSLIAIAQFAIQYLHFMNTGKIADDPTILARVTGLNGHWMAFSGQELLALCASVPAISVLGQWWLVLVAMVEGAIVLSFTRGVWLGAIVGLGAVALFLPRRVLLWTIMPVVVVGGAVAPLIYHRVALSFEKKAFPPDASRLSMLDVGGRMIHDHPLFGVGPERIRTEFPRYYEGASQEPFWYGHLHNNFMQTAAERGLICLAAFLWFIVELYRGLIRLAKNADSTSRWMALSALSALTGFLVEGLFEYNFGDSEVLLLMLFIVSAPFGLLCSKKS